MTNEDYQQKTQQYAVYPKEHAYAYLALGLASEAGEAAGKIKKWIRGDYDASHEFLRSVDAELGDVIWYISQWCNETGSTLSALMEQNIEKLEARKQRNTIRGNGDNR